MFKIDFIHLPSPLFFIRFFLFQSSLVNWERDESLRDIGAGTRVATETNKQQNIRIILVFKIFNFTL